jgi:hypothetical protein
MLTSDIEGLDVVLTTRDIHSLVLESSNMFGQNMAQVQLTRSLKYGAAVGRASLTFDDNGNLLTANAAAAMPLTNETLSQQSAWANVLAKNQQVVETLSTVLGYSSVEVYGQKGSPSNLGGCRYGDCGMGRLVVDALRHTCEVYFGTGTAGGCDIAMANGGGIRGSFAAGNVTSKDLLTVFPFDPSPHSIVSVTGETLWEAIQHMTAPGNLGGSSRSTTDGAFLHFSGLRYAWNSYHDEVLRRIVTVEVYDRNQQRWGPLQLDRRYTMITGDFYAIYGGGGYDMFPANVVVKRRLIENPRQIVTRFILKNNGTISVPSLDDLAACNDGVCTNIATPRCAHCRVVRTHQVITWYEACATGHYRDRYTAPPVCRPCLPGSQPYMVSTETGDSHEIYEVGVAFECRLCEPGTYAPEAGSTRCLACPRTTGVAEGRGNVACTPCPKHTTRQFGSDGANITDCVCDDGFINYYGLLGRECSKCPIGGDYQALLAEGVAGATLGELDALPSWWRTNPQAPTYSTCAKIPTTVLEETSRTRAPM